MVELLQRISASRNVHHHSKFVVISDANTFFIQTFLTSRRPPLIADAIITNQADKTDDGYLKLTPYEQQQTCPLCPRNLCKGAALERYIAMKGPFNKVYYTGNQASLACKAYERDSFMNQNEAGYNMCWVHSLSNLSRWRRQWRVSRYEINREWCCFRKKKFCNGKNNRSWKLERAKYWNKSKGNV